MLVRIISGIVGAAVLVGILLAGQMAVEIAVAAAALIALYEMYRSVGVVKNPVVLLLGGIMAVVLPLMGGNHSLIFLLVILYTIAMLAAMLFNHEKIKVEDMAKTYCLTLYITLFISCIAYIRGMENGASLIWIVLIGSFASDIFAYFVGVFLGKHKLCPKISPKKTIEGAVGGIVGTALCFVLYGVVLSTFLAYDVSYLQLIILGVIAAAISQLGDLTASVIKRQYGIKDYGNLMPGHGGIMDRCDSLIFVAPVVYLYLTFVGSVLH